MGDGRSKLREGIENVLILPGIVAGVCGLLWVLGWLQPIAAFVGLTDPPSSYTQPDREPVEPVQDAPPSMPEYAPDRAWVCGYSPTYNNDWHDDALCTNGTEQDRPYLLPNQSFITEADLMRAAAEYEEVLNSQY